MSQRKKKQKPVYSHNCDKCVFLGTWEWREVLYDMYTCKQGTLNLPTVIARFSSEEKDYISGIEVARALETQLQRLDEINHPLVEALHRAFARGLLTKREVP
jgi:hypothetical protein